MQEIPWDWDADSAVMRPDPKYRQLALSRLTPGHRYVLQPVDAVSSKARGRFHVLLKKIHDSLSEADTAQFPTVTDLRHHCLIKSGWMTDSYSEAKDEQNAKALAAIIMGMHREKGVVVVTSGNRLRIGFPKSQKVGDPDEGFMTKEEYQRSVEDVLAYGCAMIDTTLAELERA